MQSGHCSIPAWFLKFTFISYEYMYLCTYVHTYTYIAVYTAIFCSLGPLRPTYFLSAVLFQFPRCARIFQPWRIAGEFTRANLCHLPLLYPRSVCQFRVHSFFSLESCWPISKVSLQNKRHWLPHMRVIGSTIYLPVSEIHWGTSKSCDYDWKTILQWFGRANSCIFCIRILRNCRLKRLISFNSELRFRASSINLHFTNFVLVLQPVI